MYEALLYIHSITRYIIIILLLIVIVRSFKGRAGNVLYTPRDRKITSFTVIFADIQLVIGVLLLFVGPLKENFNHGMKSMMSSDAIRFQVIEHPMGMLIAIVLFHIGNSKAKRSVLDQDKFRKTFIFFLIGFIIIMACIPWPFMPQGRPYLP